MQVEVGAGLKDPLLGARARARLLLALHPLACANTTPTDEAWTPQTTSSDSSESPESSSSSSSPSSSSGSTTDPTGTTTADTSGGDPPPQGPTRYPHDRIHSPITPTIATHLQLLRTTGPALADDVFLKAGASSDVSPDNLHCFATGEVDLGAHLELSATLDLFLAGDAAGTTPFDRDSLATESGRSASWAIQGDPSPLQLELDAIAPGLALVHFGTNDMELGVDPGTAMPGFHESMSELLDQLAQQGVVPILVGLTVRGDDPDADRWIPTYNAVLRAMAQQRQLPFLDAWLATFPLPGHGLGPDGLHLESYEEGPCIFTDVGLTHGYNVRNLVQLEALARTTAALADDPPDDEVLPPVVGDGSGDAPFEIDRLPFIHDADTTTGAAAIDLYDCSPSDQSGPELVYAIELDAAAALRVVVLDREGVDVDVHVLTGTGPRSCIARDDDIAAGTFDAGPLRIVVDSWSDGDADYPGRYLLAVVPCDPDDPACTP